MFGMVVVVHFVICLTTLNVATIVSLKALLKYYVFLNASRYNYSDKFEKDLVTAFGGFTKMFAL